MLTFVNLIEALSCSTDHVVTNHDLSELKILLDTVWKRLGIDIAFTSHFLDRVNDERNKRQITVCELAKLFMEAFKKFGSKLAHISQQDWEAVLTDSQTNLNVPFVLKHTVRGVEIVSKTIMRKANFYTPDPKLAVAGFKLKSFGMWLTEWQNN